jgi:hypothetical protein
MRIIKVSIFHHFSSDHAICYEGPELKDDPRVVDEVVVDVELHDIGHLSLDGNSRRSAGEGNSLVGSVAETFVP